MTNLRRFLAITAIIVLPVTVAQARSPDGKSEHGGGTHRATKALPTRLSPSASVERAKRFAPPQRLTNKNHDYQAQQTVRQNATRAPVRPLEGGVNRPNRGTAVQLNPSFSPHVTQRNFPSGRGGNQQRRGNQQHHPHQQPQRRWNNNGHQQHHQHHSNVVVYPWLGGFGLYAGWGSPYYGSGYRYASPLYSRGFYSGYPYYANYTTIYSSVPAGAPLAQNQVVGNQLAPNQAAPNLPAQQPGDPAAAAADFSEQGEVDFKAGRYEAAARQWQHALVDDPQNGATIMLLAQSLFALGNYDEAAGATQAAMQVLPEEKWGTVIENFSQLYGNVQDYTDQLKALEKALDSEPDSPALRFLLGFHFGYLGYPKHAVRELDKGLNLAPGDLGAQKVRGIFAAKWPEAPPLPAAAAAATAGFDNQLRQGAPPAAQPPAAGQPARPQPTPQPDLLGTPS